MRAGLQIPIKQQIIMKFENKSGEVDLPFNVVGQGFIYMHSQ